MCKGLVGSRDTCGFSWEFDCDNIRWYRRERIAFIAYLVQLFIVIADEKPLYPQPTMTCLFVMWMYLWSLQVIDDYKRYCDSKLTLVLDYWHYHLTPNWSCQLQIMHGQSITPRFLTSTRPNPPSLSAMQPPLKQHSCFFVIRILACQQCTYKQGCCRRDLLRLSLSSISLLIVYSSFGAYHGGY